MRIPYYRQRTVYTCGAASMRMALGAFGIERTEKELAKSMRTNSDTGTSQKAMIAYCKVKKLRSLVKKDASLSDISAALKKGFVVIVLYYCPRDKGDHYSVVLRVGKDYIYFNDPWSGPRHRLTTKYFQRVWGSVCSEPYQRWFLAIRKV